MYNNFELNEKFGIGIIQDDNYNNLLIKTDANEEQLTAILEKENEIEYEENNIKNLNNEIKKIWNIYLDKMYLYFKGLMSILLVAFLWIISNHYLINILFTIAVSVPQIMGYRIKKSFRYNKKMEKQLLTELENSEAKIEKLKKELEDLNNQFKIENIDITKIQELPIINYPKSNEEENTNNYTNDQSVPLKIKSLRKDFTK